jgi:hypothetical protein
MASHCAPSKRLNKNGTLYATQDTKHPKQALENKKYELLAHSPKKNRLKTASRPKPHETYLWAFSRKKEIQHQPLNIFR